MDPILLYAAVSVEIAAENLHRFPHLDLLLNALLLLSAGSFEVGIQLHQLLIDAVHGLHLEEQWTLLDPFLFNVSPTPMEHL